jgi:hypothetical protein
LGHNDWIFDPPFAGERFHPMLTILELGAGTGIVTSRIIEAVATREQDIVISTDLPEVCPLLEANLEQTLSHGTRHRTTLRVRPLAWGNARHAIEIGTELGLAMPAMNLLEPHYLTHILCSDLVCNLPLDLHWLTPEPRCWHKVYFTELFAPLLRTLIQLSSPPFILLEPVTLRHGLTIVISYTIRSLAKETPFWSSFGLWFTFEPVVARRSTRDDGIPQPPWSRFRTLPDGHDFLFVARRRPESLDWRMPDSDQDLLDGVGAWGTDSKKGDDTFETVLLMGLGDSEEEK